jgi:hypothetical protein
MISLKPRILHACSENPQHPKNKRMGEPWSLFGSFVNRKVLLPLSVFKPQIVQPVLLL